MCYSIQDNMARTKHTMRRMRRRGGGEGDPIPAAAPAAAAAETETETEPAAAETSMWDKMSSTVSDLTKGGRGRRHLRGGYAGSVKHPGAATYATAVGGRRHRGGSHGVGVAAFASPFTQGGRRRRRKTRRRHHKR